MTPRERVSRAVNHQVPDRVPIDLGGMKASGIAVTAYDRVKRMLGIPGPTKVLDPRFMIAVVEDAVLQRLHVDVVPLDLSDDPEHGPAGQRVDSAPPVRRHGAAVPARHEHRRRRRGQLDPAERRRVAHHPSRCRRTATTSTTRRSTRAIGSTRRSSGRCADIPDEHLTILSQYGRSLYREHRLCHPGLGIRRVLPGPEPDHGPRQQRHARAAGSSG